MSCMMGKQSEFYASNEQQLVGLHASMYLRLAYKSTAGGGYRVPTLKILHLAASISS